jgi:hypothetical protein
MISSTFSERKATPPSISGYIREFQMLKLKKWEEQASFNPINVENGVAIYNPFWIAKGYDRFREPTLVTPGP